MSDKVLLYEQPAAGVALLTLNRPAKKNALSSQLRHEISRSLVELAEDNAIESVVLTGAGETFCAGFDLKELAQGDHAAIFTEAQAYHRDVYSFAKPIVAAINGPALAGGMDLATMCDIRIASQNAIFGQPQVRMGIAAAYDLMRTVVAESQARYLCLTGDRISAERAFEADFVSEIVDPTELINRSIELVSNIVTAKVGSRMKQAFIVNQPNLFGA